MAGTPRAGGSPRRARDRPATQDPSWSTPPEDREPDLMRNVRRNLQSGEPLDLLAEVSTLLTLVDPREYGLARREGEPPYSLPQLVDMFLDVDRVETSALLAVIAELAGDDDLLAARIRRELARRGDRLPEWLARLGEAEVYRAQEMVHVLGDGDNVNVAVRFAGGAELTAVVYIDHNVGTLVKDAFVVPETIAGLQALMRAKADDPDTVWRDLDLADARVRITEAIELAAMTVPPFESDTWPVCRPIVEWLTRQMPDGRKRLRAPRVAGAGPPAAGRSVLRLRVRRATRRHRPSPAPRVDHLVRGGLRARRSAALEPGGRRDHPRGLDPAQARRRRDVPVEGPRSAASVRPLLPRRTRHPRRADAGNARRDRQVRAGVPAHDPVTAAAGTDGPAGGDGGRRPRRAVGCIE